MLRMCAMRQAVSEKSNAETERVRVGICEQTQHHHVPPHETAKRPGQICKYWAHAKELGGGRDQFLSFAFCGSQVMHGASPAALHGEVGEMHNFPAYRAYVAIQCLRSKTLHQTCPWPCVPDFNGESVNPASQVLAALWRSVLQFLSPVHKYNVPPMSYHEGFKFSC